VFFLFFGAIVDIVLLAKSKLYNLRRVNKEAHRTAVTLQPQ